MGKFSDLLRDHFNRGIGRGGPGQPGDQWTAPQFAHEIGSSDRIVRYWLKGQNLPERRWLKRIEQVLFGTDPAFEAQRHALREARELDLAEDSGRFKAFGSKGHDPYSEDLMPADAVDCYETLFPDGNERDAFEDILRWVKLAREYDGDWKELLCTMQEEGRCSGFAFLSLYRPMGWWFGNYFGVLDDWRKDERAARFLKFISDKCEAIDPRANGIVFEVERFDEQHIDSVLRRCDAKDAGEGWKPGEKISLSDAEKYSINAALRISVYTEQGLGGRNGDAEERRTASKRRLPGALAVFQKEHSGFRFVDYVQPAMDRSLDLNDERKVRSKEVDLWLMVYPLEPMMRRMQPSVEWGIRYPLKPQEVDEIMSFLYAYVFPDAYGREEQDSIPGFSRYCREVRRRVEAGFEGKPLFLTNYGILSRKWQRLLGRYGRRKLDLG